MDDRRVHATLADGTEIVRYDRAGKWYVEGRSGRRVRVSIGAAVRMAQEDGAVHHRNLYGGSTFERMMEAPDAEA